MKKPGIVALTTDVYFYGTHLRGGQGAHFAEVGVELVGSVPQTQGLAPPHQGLCTLDDVTHAVDEALLLGGKDELIVDLRELNQSVNQSVNESCNQ
jgi:hypothetical protein